MSTYNHKQVLADYAAGKLDVEMAIGHTLQHIGKLYESQLGAQADQQKVWQTINTLQTEITRVPKLQAALVQLQQVVARLITHTELALPKSSKKPPPQP